MKTEYSNRLLETIISQSFAAWSRTLEPNSRATSADLSTVLEPMIEALPDDTPAHIRLRAKAVQWTLCETLRRFGR